ncbi:MAG: FtsX-like permease family protein [Candidatus Riflebacteria bacterium]|nr:FtsX-like permease family protein [Candidatus Riflebacteria bacterium]
MSFFQLVVHSLRRHALSSLAAVLSLALGVALMTATVSLREQTHRFFLRVGLGVDAVVGPRGSPLQIVLNSLYHLEEMPGTIPWQTIEEIRRNPVVTAVIPFISGHSYAGVRVNAIDPSFFTDLEIQPGRGIGFDAAGGGQGRGFPPGARHQAVAGWEAARKLGIKLGDTFSPACGVTEGAPVHGRTTLTFVGIMARTGTPHDRAIYIPLEDFFTLEGHGEETREMLTDHGHREVSGALLKIRRIRGDLLHPGLKDLQYALRKDPRAQVIFPNEVLPQLFSIIGWVDHLVLGIAGLVVLIGTLFLLVALLWVLRERRRDYALLRCLGASRRWVFGLIMAEAVCLSLAGGLLGLAGGHGMLGAGAPVFRAEAGLEIDPWCWGPVDHVLLPMVVVLGMVAALVPAWQAYRIHPLENLVSPS